MTSIARRTLEKVSVVVLTFNRPDRLRYSMDQLRPLTDQGAELIVVDNCSELPAQAIVYDAGVAAKVVRMSTNIGAAARNHGIDAATGQVIVTLDDDVHGLSADHCECLLERFQREPRLGAVCFQVRDEETDEQINWCHHRKLEEWSDRQFVTEEITEGAVAFRAEVVQGIALYPESFFISHEGVAAAMRILNRGFEIQYDPRVVVQHATEQQGRFSWRRYYYDTRNTFWLAAGFLPFGYGVRLVSQSVPAMCLYAVRDGYLRYWLKGVWHGIKGLPKAWRQRERPSPLSRSLLSEIQPYRPSVVYMLKRRLFRNQVGI